MSSLSMLTFPKLQGSANYDSWAKRIKAFLIHQDLWWVTVEPRPSERDDHDCKTGNITRHSDLSLPLAVRQNTWDLTNNKAFTSIQFQIDDEPLLQVEDITNANHLLAKCKALWATQGFSARNNLFQQLLSVKLEGSPTTQAYLDSLKSVHSKILHMGEQIPDWILTSILFNNLGPSWETWTQHVIQGIREQSPSSATSTFDTFLPQILDEDRRRTTTEESKAFYTNKPPTCVHCQKQHRSEDCWTKFPAKRPEGTRPRCSHCNRVGHLTEKCFQKFPHLKKSVAAPAIQSNNDSSCAFLSTSALTTNAQSSSLWYLDSGATDHMCFSRDAFTTITPYVCSVQTANKSVLQSEGIGEVVVPGKHRNITLKNCLFVPSLGFNLVSVPRITSAKCTVLFRHNGAEITNDQKTILATASSFNNAVVLDLSSPLSLAVSTSPPTLDTWHKRLGHLNYTAVSSLPKHVSGMDISPSSASPCESCVIGKMTNSISRTPLSRPALKLETVHTDLFGPITPVSLGGAKYGVTFTDEHSRFTWISFLRTKDEVFSKFKQWEAMVERQSGCKIKTLHSDNGGEYASNQFQDSLKKSGIVWKPTVPYSPEQNGIAERKNRTIFDRVRTILHQTSLPKTLWAELAASVIYLQNHCLPQAQSATPFELWTGVKPDLSHLRILGCSAYQHIPKSTGRTKLDETGRKCYLVGYESRQVFRLFDPEANRVVRAKSVVFHEDQQSAFIYPAEDAGNSLPTPIDSLDEEPSKTESSSSESNPPIPATEHSRRLSSPDPLHTAEPIPKSTKPKPNVPNPTPITGRRKFHHSPESETEDELNAAGPYLNSHKRQALLSTKLPAPEPTSLNEAMTGPEAQKWKEAMEEEYDSLMENTTWSLESLPAGREALSGKWVFKKKLGPDGQVSRYKARFVVRGFEQKYGLDYNLTFAPVVKSTTYRVLFSLVAKHDLELEQMDIKTAFLYGTLDETVYVQQPPGFTDGSPRVCLLKRALYGLKQAPRVWYQTLTLFLESIGFYHIDADYSLFRNKAGTMIAIYVDDLLLAGPDKDAIQSLKAQFAERFKMTDLGPCHYYLGVEVIRNRATKELWLTQRQYLRQLLAKFDAENLNPTATPMETGMRLVRADADHIASKQTTVQFQSAVGSLLYASTITRPDLAFVVGLLGRFASKPDEKHQQALKRVFRYLIGTFHYGLHFAESRSSNPPSTEPIYGYSDADWGGEHDGRRSTGGYCFFHANNLVSWSTKRQPTVALSTCEAEYMALTQAAKEAIWLKSLLPSLGLQQDTITIYEDNKSSIDLSHDPTFHARVKHIDIQHHFIREKVEADIISLVHVPSCDMIADIFTKALPRNTFEELRDRLHVLPIAD